MATRPVEQMNPMQGKGCDPESYGSPGEKEPMPGSISTSGDSDGGPSAEQVGALNALAQYHGLPSIAEAPDNVTGSLEADNATRGEGATGPVGY